MVIVDHTASIKAMRTLSIILTLPTSWSKRAWLLFRKEDPVFEIKNNFIPSLQWQFISGLSIFRVSETLSFLHTFNELHLFISAHLGVSKDFRC